MECKLALAGVPYAFLGRYTDETWRPVTLVVTNELQPAYAAVLHKQHHVWSPQPPEGSTFWSLLRQGGYIKNIINGYGHKLHKTKAYNFEPSDEVYFLLGSTAHKRLLNVGSIIGTLRHLIARQQFVQIANMSTFHRPSHPFVSRLSTFAALYKCDKIAFNLWYQDVRLEILRQSYADGAAWGMQNRPSNRLAMRGLGYFDLYRIARGLFPEGPRGGLSAESEPALRRLVARAQKHSVSEPAFASVVTLARSCHGLVESTTTRAPVRPS